MTVEEWVKFYHKNGFNILPARSKEKSPCIPTWKMYQQIKVTDEHINAWLNAKMFQNINLCLGEISNIWEIDVDVKNAPVGLLTAGYKSNEIWVCESSEGKIKIFFKASGEIPAKMDTKVNEDGGHVELRGKAHLSVLPPSIHPTGIQYKWLSNVINSELIPLDGINLYNATVKRLRAEFDYQESIQKVHIKTNAEGVRGFFFDSMKKGTMWNGASGHYFRLAFCAELINNDYDDEQIHTFFKVHDSNSGEDYSRDITQSKIDELRRKGMRCWTNKKLMECCSDIINEVI